MDEARVGGCGSEIEGDDPVDGWWTGCGRAGGAEIAWVQKR